MLGITKVNVIPVSNNNKLMAYVEIVISDEIIIHGIKVIMGENNNLFVSMPAKKLKDGTYKDIVHPISKEAREILEERILSAYGLEFERGRNQ